MTKEYGRSRVEITTGYFLRAITAYNLITVLSAPTPPGQDTIVHATETIEYYYRTLTASELTETLKIDPTQIDIFDTLLEKSIK